MKIKNNKKPKNKKSSEIRWIVRITLFSMVMSAVFTLITDELIDGSGYIVAVSALVIFIALGVGFDIVGVAVGSATEAPFHAMASHRARGAAEALWLIRNANRVSSFCNDVIGDISGIVSGATAAFVAAQISLGGIKDSIAASLIVSCLVTAVTVGGKAVGKTIAMKNTNAVLLRVGVILSVFKRHGGKR